MALTSLPRPKSQQRAGAPAPAQNGKPTNEREKIVSERIDKACNDILEGLKDNDPTKLKELMEFYGAGGKAARWSVNNLFAIFVQKRDIQRPVTTREAKALGHTIMAGASLASIFIPAFEGDKEQWEVKKARLQFEDWSKESGVSPEDIKRIGEEFKEWSQSNGLSSDKALERVHDFLIECEPTMMADGKITKQLEKAVKEHASSTGAFAPMPDRGDLLYFKLVPCVLDLGRDTVGPALIESKGEDPARAEMVFAAGKAYAEELGFKVGNKTFMSAGSAREGRVDVADWTSKGKQVGTLVHEIAHHLFGDVAAQRNPDKQAPKEVRELRAESAAYLVATTLGIPMDWSCTYLQSWGATPREFLVNMMEIRRVAKEIIQGVSAHLEEVQEQSEQHGMEGIGDHEERTYTVAGKEVVDPAELHLALYNNPTAMVKIEVVNMATGEARDEREVRASELQGELLLETRDYLRENGHEGCVYIHEGVMGVAGSREEAPEGVEAIIDIQAEAVKL